MRIEQTTIADKIEQCTALQDEHWHESARNKHLMVLKPDVERYAALEAAGALLGLVAYDDHDAIIGYSVNILSRHLHYSDLNCAHNDVLFISAAHRQSPLGLRLIRETERAAKARGAHLMLWHAKETTALSAILPRMGCKVQEIIYTKEL
jgi:GNAT superfamily N-acetyltransferase